MYILCIFNSFRIVYTYIYIYTLYLPLVAKTRSLARLFYMLRWQLTCLQVVSFWKNGICGLFAAPGSRHRFLDSSVTITEAVRVSMSPWYTDPVCWSENPPDVFELFRIAHAIRRGPSHHEGHEGPILSASLPSRRSPGAEPEERRCHEATIEHQPRIQHG